MKSNIDQARYFLANNDLQKSQKYALEAVRMELLRGNIPIAESVIKEFSIQPQTLKPFVKKTFDNNVNRGQYEAAAKIGKLFGLPKEDYMRSAMKAFEQCIKRERYKKAFLLEEEFGP